MFFNESKRKYTEYGYTEMINRTFANISIDDNYTSQEFFLKTGIMLLYDIW